MMRYKVHYNSCFVPHIRWKLAWKTFIALIKFGRYREAWVSNERRTMRDQRLRNQTAAFKMKDSFVALKELITFFLLLVQNTDVAVQDVPDSSVKYEFHVVASDGNPTKKPRAQIRFHLLSMRRPLKIYLLRRKQKLAIDQWKWIEGSTIES